MPSRFAHDTAVTPLGDGRYAAEIESSWWVIRGPNGGYLAAIVLRAMRAEVADGDRRARSITLHYLRPPVAGPMTVDVTVERAGRSLSTVTARAEQGGKVCVLAVAAFGHDRDGPAFAAAAPVVPPPEETAAPPAGPADIPLRQHLDQRPLFGPGPEERGTADEALTGGWLRLTEDEPVDEVVLALLVDAWFPAVFCRVAEPLGVPTIDLTIHFRDRPDPGQRWTLVRFRTTHASGGYLEEDGEAWSPDGRLLAQSRQLALEMPFDPAALNG